MQETVHTSVTITPPTSDDLAEQLRALMALGFRFAHPRHPDGAIAAVVGVRAHDNVVDLVQLLGEHDADAARIPGDEPDILSPRHVLWRATGPAHSVLQQVLDLDDPGIVTDSAYRQNGCWLSLGPSRSVWLPASP
jgi:hypothetical protein